MVVFDMTLLNLFGFAITSGLAVSSNNMMLLTSFFCQTESSQPLVLELSAPETRQSFFKAKQSISDYTHHTLNNSAKPHNSTFYVLSEFVLRLEYFTQTFFICSEESNTFWNIKTSKRSVEKLEMSLHLLHRSYIKDFKTQKNISSTTMKYFR